MCHHHIRMFVRVRGHLRFSQCAESRNVLWIVDLKCEWSERKRSSKAATTTAHGTWRARCEDDISATQLLPVDLMTQVLSHARKNHVCGSATCAWDWCSVYMTRAITTSCASRTSNSAQINYLSSHFLSVADDADRKPARLVRKGRRQTDCSVQPLSVDRDGHNQPASHLSNLDKPTVIVRRCVRNPCSPQRAAAHIYLHTNGQFVSTRRSLVAPTRQDCL